MELFLLGNGISWEGLRSGVWIDEVLEIWIAGNGVEVLDDKLEGEEIQNRGLRLYSICIY